MPAEAHGVPSSNSRIARLRAARARAAACFGLGSNHEFLIGVEAEFRGLPLTADRRHDFVDQQLIPGCLAWMFTNADGITTVGVACLRPRKPDLDALLKRLAPLADFDAAQLVEKRGGLVSRADWKLSLS